MSKVNETNRGFDVTKSAKQNPDSFIRTLLNLSESIDTRTSYDAKVIELRAKFIEIKRSYLVKDRQLSNQLTTKYAYMNLKSWHV